MSEQEQLLKLALTVEDLRTEGRRVDPNPTDAQRRSGSYKKGHVSWKGLGITIETVKGQTRSGVGRDGKPWSVVMKAMYGYFKLTESDADGDHVDVFIGEDDLDSEIVFVINQVDPITGKFDEHKVCIGISNEAAAKKLYLDNYSAGWQGYKSCAALTLKQFKDWLRTGDTGKELRNRHVLVFDSAKAAGDRVTRSSREPVRILRVWHDCVKESAWHCPDCRHDFEGDDPACDHCGAVCRSKEAADRPFTIAVDLDGTLAELQTPHDPDKIAEPRDGMREWLKKWKKAGARLILWTVRGDKKMLREWLDRHVMPIEHINENPDQPEGSSAKIIADCYVDDRGIPVDDIDEMGDTVMERMEAEEGDGEDKDSESESANPAVVVVRTTRYMVLPDFDSVLDAIAASDKQN